MTGKPGASLLRLGRAIYLLGSKDDGLAGLGRQRGFDGWHFRCRRRTDCAVECNARTRARTVHRISNRAVHAPIAPGLAANDTPRPSEVP
jgi:hypothetical protein